MKFVSIVLFLILPINCAFSENLNKAYFAGGCFWCMEESFEKLEGVKEVISGYSGGTTSNPTYKEVTFGDTGHFEVVEIIYNNNIISYNEKYIYIISNFFNQNINIFSLPLHFGKTIFGSHGGESNPNVDIPRYLNLIQEKNLQVDKLIN